MVKKYLTYKGIEYEEVNLDDHPERRAEAEQASGARTTPVTIITQDDSRRVVVGYNLRQLAPALVRVQSR